jgi:2-polyprenyl-6-methoxyphenol hydroxylase-like FAD-dependent oxidoreductase
VKKKVTRKDASGKRGLEAGLASLLTNIKETPVPAVIADHAVVIGAGMGGLAAAKAVAPYFGRVTVLDRDALPDGPECRSGTPQARHAHALLAGGSRALEALFPGIADNLLEAGALTGRAGLAVRYEQPGFDPFPQRDLGFDAFFLSRPLLENVCRARLQEEPNVELRHRSRVTDVAQSPNRREALSVHCEDNDGKLQTLAADLVVDASGRGAPTMSLLEKLGASGPEVSEIGIDQAYATAVFEIPPDASRDWMGLAHFGNPAEENNGGGLILPIEHGRWIVSIGRVHGGALPGEIEGFKAFTKSFRTPTLFDAINRAKHVGEIARYNMPASVRRHFHRSERFPDRLIPLGDSVCRFNPVFGQGMSVAAQEAVALNRLLDSRSAEAAPLDGLAQAYLASIQDLLEAPWAVAQGDFVFPETRGTRPPEFEKRLRYGAALTRLAAEDAETHRIVIEVRHLLRPQSALREPELAKRVTALMTAMA